MKHRIVQKQNPIMLVLAIAQTLLLLTIAVQLGGVDLVAKEAKATGDAPTAAAPSAPTAAPSAPTPSAPAPAAAVDMSQFTGHSKGSDDAEVVIVEWSDFECPFCARFYSQTLTSIDANYIETGKVKLIYKHFPLSFHPNAQKAAEATECAADQGKFWEMHDELFEQGVSGGVAQYKQIAGDLGLDQEAFDNCLDSGEKAQRVQDDMAEGAANGITGTPGFLVAGQKVSGAQPFAVFQAAIDAALN